MTGQTKTERGHGPPAVRFFFLFYILVRVQQQNWDGIFDEKLIFIHLPPIKLFTAILSVKLLTLKKKKR